MPYDFMLADEFGVPIGVPESATGRELRFALNSPCEASLTVSCYDVLAGSIRPGLTRIKVYSRDASPRLVFYGLLPVEGVEESAGSGEMRLTFMDPLRILASRWTTGLEVFTGVDQGDIAWGLIAFSEARGPGHRTWMVQGGTATGTVRDRSYDRRPVLELIRNLSEVIGGIDFWVSPHDAYESSGDRDMGLFNASLRRGSPRPGSPLMLGDGLPSNITDAVRTYAPLVTLSTWTGVNGAGAEITGFTGDPNSSVYGVWETVASDSDVSNQQTLVERSQRDVMEFGFAREVITVSGLLPGGPQPFIDFGLGDILPVTVRRGAIAFAGRELRVHGFRLVLDQQGGSEVELTLST